MRRLFKPKNRPLSARQQVLAERAANRIIRFQQRCAGYLERRTAYWSRSSKIIALLFYISLFGGLSLWLLLEAIL